MTDSAELRQQIEDLAVQVVIGENEAGTEMRTWLPLLEQIRERARCDEAREVLAATDELIGRLKAGSAELSVAGEMQRGLARLQQALDTDVSAKPAAELSPAEDPELLTDFIVESREHLSTVEAQVLIIEKDPHNAEALNAVFRGFHTIKGLAGFLELWEIQKLAHEVETVLDRARNNQLTIHPGAIDVILQSTDYLRRWLAYLEVHLQGRPSDPPGRDEALLNRIQRLTGGAESSNEASADIAAMTVAVESPVREATASETTPLATRRSDSMTVKVDTSKLDYLVDMAGEMVIAETLVRHDPELATIKSPKLQRKIAQLTRITAELQKTAMAMRLVPIGPLFRRMARLVRDLARQCGKRVEMETEGDEIELDRTIVEELADPLMHMVRNAMDHGIETPPERQQCGKNPAGKLLLKAHHHAGQVVIEIADDGRGLNRERILAKAVERGLVASGEGMADADIYNLIFLPGFSTAGKVTNVSGRGVGMDVVRRHIEKLRGRIEIRSTPGEGSTFLLKLPLTLAIIDGLVVGVGAERYIVPLFAVREMFRPLPDTLWTVQQRGEMALVRGDLLPVRRLYRRFQVTPRTEDPLSSVLVVAEVEGQKYCLLVDELIGKQEVVIKSLGETFQHISGVAGAAILGDGRVGLILDLDRLFKDVSGESTR